MFLATAVPAALLLALFRRTLIALWQAPLVQRLRQSHWSLRVAALLVLALVTAYGGSKGGSTNAQNNASGGSAKPGGTPIDSGTIISRTDTTLLLEAMSANIQQGRPATQGLQIREADGSVAPVPLFQAPVPDWYLYSAQDSDQDGIPDLWEIWTHGDPLVRDSLIDRDGDGITDLYEFYHQTDPRTADTDGDGLSDYEEIELYNTNPLVKQDFTVEEPDENEDGIIDLWEGSGYLYDFVDTNNDGFDDRYAGTMPLLSEAWYDVLVEVVSSRSAALVWDNAGDSGGIVLTACPSGQLVRLRLPFEADTSLRLLPAPEGIDPPGGEPWKARLKISFAPHGDYDTKGTCLLSGERSFLHKEVLRETCITVFKTQNVSGCTIQPLDSSGGSIVPETAMLYKAYDITPGLSYYHAGDSQAGPFTLTDTVGIDPESIIWSSPDGTMTPAYGVYSTLTITNAPSLEAPILVKASYWLDDDHVFTRKAEVRLCQRQSFALDSCTDNFAPLPGSNAVFCVSLPGCQHQNDPGWLEAEVVRITTSGIQHVAWIDMDASREGLNRYVHTTDLGYNPVFSWDGIVQDTLSQARYPEVFTKGAHNFNLAAPPADAGQPVPPPYVTLVVKLWNEEKTSLLGIESCTIYVPQIVQVRWETTATDLFRRARVYLSPDLSATNFVYSGYTGTVEALMDDTISIIQTHFPETVNIVCVPFYSPDILVSKYVFITAESKKVSLGWNKEGFVLGKSKGNTYLQRSAAGEASCYFGSMRNCIYNYYEGAIEAGKLTGTFFTPISSERMLKVVCKTAVHEVGHTLGLVDSYYLYGTEHSHNKSENQQYIMHEGSDLEWFFKIMPTLLWESLNLQYLEFVLPVSLR